MTDTEPREVYWAADIQEAQFEAFLASLRRRHIRLAERGRDVSYLKSLVAEIRPRMRNAERYPSIRVYVAESTATDARAFPSGIIVCSAGLIDFAQSEAALVGVLAHELSHIDRGHQLRSARNLKIAQEAFANGDHSFEDFAQTGKLLAKQFARPFRPEEEVEADLDAATWMFEIDYQPLEMALLFRRLDRRDHADPVPMPSFLRTHPYHAQRYRAIKELASRLKALHPEAKPYVGKKNLRRRIPRRRKRFPE